MREAKRDHGKRGARPGDGERGALPADRFPSYSQLFPYFLPGFPESLPGAKPDGDAVPWASAATPSVASNSPPGQAKGVQHRRRSGREACWTRRRTRRSDRSPRPPLQCPPREPGSARQSPGCTSGSRRCPLRSPPPGCSLGRTETVRAEASCGIWRTAPETIDASPSRMTIGWLGSPSTAWPAASASRNRGRRAIGANAPSGAPSMMNRMYGTGANSANPRESLSLGEGVAGMSLAPYWRTAWSHGGKK